MYDLSNFRSNERIEEFNSEDKQQNVQVAVTKQID
jgi:hypothetical protein